MTELSSSTLRPRFPPKIQPIVEAPRRYNVLYGGRGSTKSWTVARLLSINGMAEPRRVLCAREFQNSLQESVYQLLIDQQRELGIDYFYTPTKDAIVGENGTQFLFKGIRTHDIAKIKSLEGVDDCWIEEAHVISEKSWRVLIPTIRKKGSRFYVTFNPELEDDPTYERMIANPPQDSHVIKLNYSDNPWFEETELAQERIDDYERDTTHDKHIYKHVWEGFTLPAVEGAIFANEVAKFLEENRFRPVDYDPMGKVHGIMDLGYGVMTMVLAQRFASTVQIIGYHEWRNSTYAKITKELKALYDFDWGKIWMPHDAAHRDPKTGKSHAQVMEDLGWETEAVPQEGVENYIEKGRRLFETCYISDNCEDLLRCLRRFKYKVSEQNEHKRMAPDKDDFSHGAEAFCYTAVVADQLSNSRPVTNPYKAFRTYAA